MSLNKEEKESLRDTAFFTIVKNLEIEYVKTGKKDIFHSMYRLVDYWTLKESVEKFKKKANELKLGENSQFVKGENAILINNVFKIFDEIFGNFSEDNKENEE